MGALAVYRAFRAHQYKVYEQAGRAALNEGAPGVAEELLTKSLRYADVQHPKQRRYALACMHNLGMSLLRQGKYDEAAARLEEVAGLCSSAEPHASQTISSLALLGKIYWSMGRVQQPITVCNWILDFITEHPSVRGKLAGGHSDLASAYLRAGDYGRALVNLEKAVELERQFDGDPENASTFARSNRGVLHQKTGEFEQAEKIWEEVLAIREKSTDEKDDRPARIRANLAWLRCQQKRFQEAEDLARQVLDKIKSKRARGHVLQTLAVLCTVSGRLDEADGLFAQVSEIRLGLMVHDHPEILRLNADVAMLRMAQGRMAEAEDLLINARPLMEAKLGGRHPDVAEVLYRFGLLRERQGRTVEAKDLFESALAIKTRTAPAHPETEDCRKALEELGA
jgi:tetratricopeptide (TPR) repeat protein